jgi:hypothetical protein
VPPTLLSEDGNIFLTVSGTSWSLEQWSLTSVTRTPRGYVKTFRRYAKTSYGICKIKIYIYIYILFLDEFIQFILDLEYRRCITWIIHQQLRGVQSWREITCGGFANKKKVDTNALEYRTLDKVRKPRNPDYVWSVKCALVFRLKIFDGHRFNLWNSMSVCEHFLKMFVFLVYHASLKIFSALADLVWHKSADDSCKRAPGEVQLFSDKCKPMFVHSVQRLVGARSRHKYERLKPSAAVDVHSSQGMDVVRKIISTAHA